MYPVGKQDMLYVLYACKAFLIYPSLCSSKPTGYIFLTSIYSITCNKLNFYDDFNSSKFKEDKVVKKGLLIVHLC